MYISFIYTMGSNPILFYIFFMVLDYNNFLINTELMTLNEVINIFGELFFGLAILFLILHSILLASNKKKNYPLIQKSIIKLSIFILFLTFCIFYNTELIYNCSFFDNTLIIDNLSIIAKLTITLFSILCFFIIEDYLDLQKINSFEYIILILFSILGIFLICSSNNLITIYLAIEIQSLSFYLLAAYKRTSIFSTEAGLKYFILGSFSSSFFLFGSSLIYGATGTTNFEDFKDLYFLVQSKINQENYLNIFSEIHLLELGLMFLVISLFFKLALAPFHVWAPDIYEGSLTSSTVFFAIIPKLGIFILLIRFFYYSFYGFLYDWRQLFMYIALFSVLVGSFAGLEQKKVKSLLAYSSIGHMGYSLISFSSGTFEGLQSLLCYLFIYMLASLSIWTIFLSIQLKKQYLNKTNKDLADFVLLVKSNNCLAISFTIALLTLAGFPPFIGFFAKFNVFFAAIESSMFFAAIIAIFCSVISTFYYVRIIKIIYFENGTSGKLYKPINYINSLIISICSFLFIYLFINPNLFYFFYYQASFL